MTCQPNKIHLVEDNGFALLLTLKRRTYVSNLPIDEDIVATDLTDVTFKLNDTEYPVELGTDGVRVVFEHGLKRGVYNIILRAKYHGSDITAAYFEAITAEQWNYQSDAEQFIQGSPIVMEAAYVIGGALTDAELEALKEQYREAIEDLREAEEEAEAAKEAFVEKAAALDDVAKQSTLTQGVQDIRNDISHIDTSTLAKETTAEAAKQAALDAKTAAQAITGYALQGADATATNTAIAALIGYTIQEIDGV